ncbi:MAG: hypothetical protein CMJ58_26525 [Planctomycetaceae bacterium]|nr:hypothetical protein [Planctomycetaceae bacterium]
MTPMISNTTNRNGTRVRAANRREQAEQEFARMLSAVSVTGFHGTATVAVSLQDGHIQHLRVSTERMVK